ncbi:MAG: ATPase, T2SS/T4P/T4SS family, partial [Planctomycetota bacterium]
MKPTFSAPPIEPHRSERCAAALEKLLAASVSAGASDLHLSAGLPPMLRINGEVFPMEGGTRMQESELDSIVRHLASGTNLKSYEATGSLDGAVSSLSGVRFRFNIYRRQDTTAIALRRLEDKLHSLADLGLSEQLYEVCENSHGLVVVSGPTGSGKSTTLAAFLDRINQERRTHIITIEDTIEYLHPP